jgi:hypothetical protein
MPEPAALSGVRERALRVTPAWLAVRAWLPAATQVRAQEARVALPDRAATRAALI